MIKHRNAYVLSLMLCMGLSFAPNAGGQTEKVLHIFTGNADGGFPYSGTLVSDNAGNLYGTALKGGDGPCVFPYKGCGVVFELERSSKGRKYTVLYSFRGGSDGQNPGGPLLIDQYGDLYGTTQLGGTNKSFGNGTIFMLRRVGNSWKETILYKFHGEDGESPDAGLVQGSNGEFYGTTPYGGDSNCVYSGQYGPGCGVIYELSKAGTRWQQHVLHRFHGDDGALTFVGVALLNASASQTSSPAIVGVAQYGGYPAKLIGDTGGVAFELDRSVGGWKYRTLYKFPPGNGRPAGTPLSAPNGTLYGTTGMGGEYGMGSLFELNPPKPGQKAWRKDDIYSFDGSNGLSALYQGVVMDAAGALYGTASRGGTSQNCQAGCGTAYKLTQTNGVWGDAMLFSFQGGSDGWELLSGVTLDDKGNLYGTTYDGGDPTCQCGVIYEITP